MTCSKKWNEQSTNKHTHKHTHKKVTQNIRTEGKIRGNKRVNRSLFSIRETTCRVVVPGHFSLKGGKEAENFSSPFIFLSF